MPKQHHKPEDIVAKLRQVDVLVSQGHPVADAIRSIGGAEVSYDRWRREFGGLKTDQLRRLKELEPRTRLRRAVATSNGCRAAAQGDACACRFARSTSRGSAPVWRSTMRCTTGGSGPICSPLTRSPMSASAWVARWAWRTYSTQVGLS